jgi:hypothetical protein
MKPAPIAKYLDHFGAATAETVSPDPENSPFRPRSRQNPLGAEPRSAVSFDRAARAIGATRPQAEGRARPTPSDDRRPATQPNFSESLAAREAAKAEELAARLAEAYTRGLREGRAEAWEEAEGLRAADRTAAEERAAAERNEFKLNEYAKLEAAIREGLAEIDENVGAAVARILAPFLDIEVVKHATDALRENIARLCTGGGPALIRIRGPERVLRRLRERIGPLAAAVEYAEDDGVEVVVEAGSILSIARTEVARRSTRIRRRVAPMG